MKIVDNKGLKSVNSEKNELQNGKVVEKSLAREVTRNQPLNTSSRTTKREVKGNSVSGVSKSPARAPSRTFRVKDQKHLSISNSKAKMKRGKGSSNLRLMPKDKYNILTSKSLKNGVVLSAVKHAAKGVTKVASSASEAVKSQVLKKDDDGNVGLEGAKYGLRAVDKAGKKARKIYNRVENTVDNVRKIQKRISRRSSSRIIQKRTLKTAKTAGKTTAKAAKSAAKTAQRSAKAARVAARTAQRAAQTAVKVAQKVAQVTVKVIKAAVEAIKQLVSLIAETAPWSLIIIAVIIVLLLLVYLIGALVSTIEGQTAGGGAWVIDDSAPNTPQDIYNNLEKFLDETGKSLEAKAQNPLKSEITNFCDGDINKPRRILEYTSENNSVLYFPASGHDAIVNGYIDNFDLEFYPDFLATLFVLMTRDKQKADGMDDTTIYDFDFKRSDFEEFIGTVDNNSCKYGATYVYKTTTEIPNCACPGENCETRTLPGCKCCSYTDEHNHTQYYCGGHPYCPHKHTKLQVRLYTIQEYTGRTLSDIYNFTDNENIRFEAAKAFIEGLIRDYGGDTSS